MRYFLFLIFCFFSTSTLFAKTVTTQIHSVIEGDRTIIKFSNGMVGFSQKNFLNLFSTNNFWKVELDADHNILSLEMTSTPLKVASEKMLDLPHNVSPTIMDNPSKVKDVFRRLNSTYLLDSECYNRSHVWTYEEFTEHDIVLNKAFLFFSDEYIKKYTFKWWFHVAPYALYRQDRALYAAVLDHQFSQGPQSFKQWTDTWIETKKACKVITKYSEYFKKVDKADCYLMKMNMFYWQPRDIENQEKGDLQERNTFLQEELDYAYEEGFGVKRR